MVAMLLLFAGFVGYAYGEMCLLLPYQRGGLVPDDELNADGAAACNIRNTYENGTNAGSAPCYGRSNDDERIDQFIGRNAEQVMIAQKNKDWFNSANPGNFTFNLWSWNGGDMKFVKTLNSTKDTNSTKEFYQVTVLIPSVDQDEHYVVQAIYFTNTKDENGTVVNFYQCSDVLAI
eukprot:CAMPEP_0197074924 /NCGR_PEP_ID=MMETSP1384-20130603/211350_1 /TAXON_ID=29189 /ORGANISM="Ammonia sp." /LENGTH=175 /DNA_ID=CAMNT_0042513765 /DNA_START=23 /DNA_END=550 /DNA_ORIENTATION=-